MWDTLLPPFLLIRDFGKQILTEILETFPRVFWFPKARINENGGKHNFKFETACKFESACTSLGF